MATSHRLMENHKNYPFVSILLLRSTGWQPFKQISSSPSQIFALSNSNTKFNTNSPSTNRLNPLNSNSSRSISKNRMSPNNKLNNSSIRIKKVAKKQKYKNPNLLFTSLRLPPRLICCTCMTIRAKFQANTI